MIWKNIIRRKTRTLLTIGGITLAIAVVVFLSIFSAGLSGQMDRLMSSEGANITLMQSGIADMSFSAIDERIGKSLLEIPEVEQVSGLLLQIVPVEEKPYMLILGVDPEETYIDHFRIIDGENTISDGDVILGRMAAEFFAKQPGDTFAIQGHPLQISGVYETGTGFEDAGVVLSLTKAQEIFLKPNQVSLYRVKVKSRETEQLENFAAEIENQFPFVSAYLSSEFGRNTPDIQALETISAAISLIGLIAGALGTTNTMLMNVFERTREIGTLRAIGWRRLRVVRMITGEALFLSTLGGIVGVFLGIGLAFLTSEQPEFAGYFTVEITPEGIISGLLIAVILGILGGITPAWWATRLKPVEALRYE